MRRPDHSPQKYPFYEKPPTTSFCLFDHTCNHKPRPERGQPQGKRHKGDGGGELSPSHHMRSSTNTTSYRKSEAGEQQRRSISGSSGSSGATGTGTGTEETHLLAANNHHRKSSYQSTTVRRRSPRTTPSARNSAMDGQHLQQQYGGGQGAAAVPGEDPANQYLAYSEQQQQQQPAAQHHAQHMQYADQDQYSHDEYIHQPPIDHQYHHQQQYQYDQRQQGQQQRPPQQHEVPPPQHYAAEGVGGPAHAQPPQPPLMDQEAANAEIMAVRRSALTVFSPLTYTWLIITIGFATTVGLGMARWTDMLSDLPYWIVLLPSWLSHFGLLGCHVASARALSSFIAEANEKRQRQDSTDHLDRTEYLPLLQRALKFGLKTGLISFCIFLFEVLVYLRLVRGTMSLGAALTPIWIIVIVGFLDGIICKTQHFVRVICWALLFSSMVLAVLKVDHGFDDDVVSWRVVISPIVAMLGISSATLIYIVYGHQVGYYLLSEAQLTAGILYSMATLICVLLVATMSEVIPNIYGEDAEDMRIFVVALAPLIMVLVGMGAWAVSRDEFERLLQFGGQAAVHPMRLRLERLGWNAVETKGVTTIPMFGVVRCAPLNKATTGGAGSCACCSCYPYEDEDDLPLHGVDHGRYIPSVPSQISARTGETAAQPPHAMA